MNDFKGKQMKKTHRNTIEIFLQHWGKYVEIQPYHSKWVKQHARYTSYTRGECIYDSNWEEEQIFYVCEGMLARVDYNIDPKTAKQKRSILSIGPPQMALMTTDHLYSHTQATGEIIALRPSKILTISYQEIKQFMADDLSLDNMMAALVNKKKRQLARLRQVDTIPDSQSAYIRFTESLPDLAALLSQTEQQDLLGISRRSITRASYFHLTGKNKR